MPIPADAPVVASTSPTFLPLTGGTLAISGTDLYSDTATGTPLPTVTVGGSACSPVTISSSFPWVVTCTAPNLGAPGIGAQTVVVSLNGVASGGGATVAYLGASGWLPQLAALTHLAHVSADVRAYT